jgi:hypothetical protein
MRRAVQLLVIGFAACAAAAGSAGQGVEARGAAACRGTLAPVNAALYDRIEHQFVALVNQRRAAAHLPPFQRSVLLTRAAMMLAAYDQCHDTDAAIGPDGLNTAGRLRRAGYVSIWAGEEPWDTTPPTRASAASVYRMLAGFAPVRHEMILDRHFFKDIGFGLRCAGRNPEDGSSTCHGSFIVASR